MRALTPSEAAERVVPSAHDVGELMHGLQARLQNALNLKTTSLRSRVEAVASRPVLSRPLDNVHNLSRQVDDLAARHQSAANLGLRGHGNRLAAIGGKLEALSPLGVLGRGYSITHDRATQKLVVAARQLRIGQQIYTQFGQGSVISTVETIEQK